MISVKDVNFKYKSSKRDVLKQVTFSLKKDKVNVILGLNGAGKTTLFDCLTGIIKPLNGAINVPPLNEILYLTQSIYFSGELKGKDFAKFISRIDNRKASNTASTYVQGMDEMSKELFYYLWDTKIGRMSVGEKRWLFVIMVSNLKRNLYILDEPTSGVDPSARIKILRKIENLVKKGSYCLISTHQLQDLSHMDCHIIMLHKGRVIYEGDYNNWLSLNNTNNPDIAFENAINRPYEEI